MISIDTLRADHLGAYGYSPSVTPVLDRLARQGVVFEEVFTPVPLTLPAHASLLTGLYPPTHGVHDNGEALPRSVPTLAERLQAHGYRTAAFVGGFVLDRRFGLDRGFTEYWGDFELHRHAGVDPGDIQIRGDRVQAAAEKWLEENSSPVFFAFVHFYDLHGPYLLPASRRSRFPNRLYDGELAYVDDLIGRLWESMRRRGLAERTLLILTSDHGEGLGDHGERNHGFLLYRSTTQIPLIIRFPDGRFAGRRIRAVTRLVDVAPTACSLLAVPSLSSFQGRSLASEIAGHPDAPRPAYSETLYPFRHFHSAPLYSFRDERYGYIQAPRPELYDRRSDPRESRDLSNVNRALANSLRERLDGLMASMARGPEAAPVSAEALEKLKSLGYVGGSSTALRFPRPGSSLPDPKDRISLYRQFQDALELQARGNVRAAALRLEKIAAVDAALVAVRIEAGLARQRLKEDEVAIRHFQAALGADPFNALAHYDLGISLGNLRRDREAEQELDLAARIQPWFSRAYTARALAQARLGDFEGAVGSFGRALSIDPHDFDAWLNRGNVYGSLGEWEKARADLERAAAIEPNRAGVHEALGTLAFHRGDLERALREYRRAVALEPQSSSAHSSLGLLYQKMGRLAEGRAELQRALALDPNNSDARHALR